MSKRSERLKAKHKEGDSDGDAHVERTATVELRNPVTAAPIRRQAAQEPTPGAAAASKPPQSPQLTSGIARDQKRGSVTVPQAPELRH